jgi:hypothetical protein
MHAIINRSISHAVALLPDQPCDAALAMCLDVHDVHSSAHSPQGRGSMVQWQPSLPHERLQLRDFHSSRCWLGWGCSMCPSQEKCARLAIAQVRDQQRMVVHKYVL